MILRFVLNSNESVIDISRDKSILVLNNIYTVIKSINFLLAIICTFYNKKLYYYFICKKLFEKESR